MNKIRLGNKDIYYQVFYKGIKHMYLRVKEDRLVITCNKQISKSQIETFILKNESTILKSFKKNDSKVSLYSEEEFLLFGNNMQLFYQINQKKNTYSIQGNVIEINFSSDVFDALYIERIYRIELLKLIKEIQEEEQAELENHFNLQGITYKTQLMKSRFGSCIASRKVIKLNSILARFPKPYTRTILLHEIIHLKVQNHQKEFYKYIDLYIPNYKKIISQLNKLTRKYVI